MPLPLKSPLNSNTARSFFRKPSKETSRNLFSLTKMTKSGASRRTSSAQEDSYLDATTSRDSQKNVAQLQAANKTVEEIHLLQQNENKILEEILSTFEHASKVEPKTDDEDKNIFKDIEKLFDFLDDRVKKIKDSIKPKVTPKNRVSSTVKSIAKGAATGIAAESALSYLTGKDETLSALGIGLSPLATGTVAAVAGIKGAFELSDKFTPESRKGADIRPQDIEKAFSGQNNIEFLEDVEPFKKGQSISVEEILKAWEVGPSKEEREATIDALLKSKKAKPIKEQAKPVSSVSDPNIRPVKDTGQNTMGSVDAKKIIFDADTIRFLTNDFSLGTATASQTTRPGFQKVSAGPIISQQMTSYSDITPGADVETTNVFNNTGPDSLGQEQKPAGASQVAAPSISGIGETQRQISVSEMGNAERVIDFFTKKGYTKEQAAGIAANIQHESNFKTDAVGDSGKAYGLAQWHPNRQEKFKQIFGKDIRQSSFEEQLEYINWELNGPEKSAKSQLMSASSAADAAMKFDKYYERSSGTTTVERMKLAEKYMTGGEPKSNTGDMLNQASVGSQIGDIRLQQTTPKVIIPGSQAPNNVRAQSINGGQMREDPSVGIRLNQIFKT